MSQNVCIFCKRHLPEFQQKANDRVVKLKDRVCVSCKTHIDEENRQLQSFAGLR